MSEEIKKVKSIGIDLGTTNSVISIAKPIGENGEMYPIPLKVNNNIIVPSCIQLVKGRYIVGEEAYKNRFEPSATYSVKRLMGSNKKITLADKDNGTKIELTPEQVSSIILKKMKDEAETITGEIEDVTITVPAYFTPAQKAATIAAGKLAGFTEVRLTQEPVSAALAYQYTVDRPLKVLIFDLGGGTFDCAVVEIIPSSEDIELSEEDAESSSYLNSFFEIAEDTKMPDRHKGTIVKVVEPVGDSHLGGDDIDERILRLVLNANQVNDLTPLETKEALLKVEQFKKIRAGGTMVLSSGRKLAIAETNIRDGYMSVLNKCSKLMQPLLDKYAGSLDRIILVGGSTRSQYCRDYLRDLVGNIKIDSDLNPDEAVGLGASVYSAVSTGNFSGLEFLDVVPETISACLESGELSPIISKGSLLPATNRLKFAANDGEGDIVIPFYFGTGFKQEQNKIAIVTAPVTAGKDETISIELRVNLSGTLTAYIVTSKGTTPATLVNVKTAVVSKEGDSANGVDRVHARRLAGYKRIVGEIKLLNDDMQAKFELTRFQNLIAGYENASSQKEYYAKNKPMFDDTLDRYARYLDSKSEEKIMLNTIGIDDEDSKDDVTPKVKVVGLPKSESLS